MIKHLTAAIAAATMMAGAASAGDISFADYAAGNEHGVANGTSINFDGTVISFSAGYGDASSGVLTGPVFHPYFDDESGGLPAGLGVCRELDGDDQCLNSGDDSIDGDIQINEAIVLEFNEPFDFGGLSFRDGVHVSLNDSAGLVSWGAYTTSGFIGGVNTFAELVTLAASGGLLGVTSFGLSYVNTEFYLEAISDVPLPGALPLLLSGLAGLGFASRKKKAAA